MESCSVRKSITNIQVLAKFKLILRMVRFLICFRDVQFSLSDARKILLIRTRTSRFRSTQRFLTFSKKLMEADRSTTWKQDWANIEEFTKCRKTNCLVTLAKCLMTAFLLWKTNIKRECRVFLLCLSRLTPNQSENSRICKDS